MIRYSALLLGWFAAVTLASAADPLVAPVSFERDVMSVLSKARCNAGTCHGNVHGKGGFFLSLRGQDAQHDYRQLVEAAQGRRINRIDPEKSLILLKATATIAHEGGKRFGSDSAEYAILREWIQQGLQPLDPDAPRVESLTVTPGDTVLRLPVTAQPLVVTAQFSDGTTRDVTPLAVFESSDPLVTISQDGVVQFEEPGIVTVNVRFLGGQAAARVTLRPPRQAFVWRGPTENNFIDREIFERLRQLEIHPAPLSRDSVYVRRLYLDLLGILPTADEARQFVHSADPRKRERLVDQLLQRPEFAEMWALKWSDVVRNEEKTLDPKGVELLHDWMRDSFAKAKPLDQFVAELIAARGSTYDNPAANYWRAHREPLVRAETTAQVFLGVRLGCAKCHNHPFDHWSQDDYYRWASLFSTIDYKIVKNDRKDKFDKHEFIGEQIVEIKDEGHVVNVRSGKPAPPTFLGAAAPITEAPIREGPSDDAPSDDAAPDDAAPDDAAPDDAAPVEGPPNGDANEGAGEDRLQQLARWLTSRENRLFARAQANRIWYHLMGRGLVEPVDDLRLTNPASHPELLERLADELVASDFDVRHVIRTIVLSQTYQLDSTFADEPVGYEEELFARAIVRRLSAEQILDAQSHVLGLPADFAGYPAGTRAGQIAGVERVRRQLSDGDRFLRLFGKPERLLACECERSDEPTLGQALQLIGGASLNRRLNDRDNRIGKLLDGKASHETVTRELFWTALSRPPTANELQATLSMIEATNDPRGVFEDLAWALLNAKELLFRN